MVLVFTAHTHRSCPFVSAAAQNPRIRRTACSGAASRRSPRSRPLSTGIRYCLHLQLHHELYPTTLNFCGFVNLAAQALKSEQKQVHRAEASCSQPVRKKDPGLEPRAPNSPWVEFSHTRPCCSLYYGCCAHQVDRHPSQRCTLSPTSRVMVTKEKKVYPNVFLLDSRYCSKHASCHLDSQPGALQ